MATVRTGTAAVKRVAANPALELLERLGYAVRGALYAVMGLLALRIVFSVADGQTTDLTGSLVVLVSNPFGKLVLIIAAVGLAAYSLWGFTRAIYDPLHRGSDASGYMARLGFVSTAHRRHKEHGRVGPDPPCRWRAHDPNRPGRDRCRPWSVPGILSSHIRARPERHRDERPQQGCRGEVGSFRDVRTRRDFPDHRLVCRTGGRPSPPRPHPKLQPRRP